MNKIIKFQLPLKNIENNHNFALAISKDNTFCSFIDLDSNKELYANVCNNENKTYCICEVIGDKIDKIIKKISAQEAGF